MSEFTNSVKRLRDACESLVCCWYSVRPGEMYRIEELKEKVDAVAEANRSFPAEQISHDAVTNLGFESVGTDDFPAYRSPESNRAGPTERLIWEPYMGCDGWRLEYNDKGPIPPPETVLDLIYLMKGLGIPVKGR